MPSLYEVGGNGEQQQLRHFRSNTQARPSSDVTRTSAVAYAGTASGPWQTRIVAWLHGAVIEWITMATTCELVG